MEDKLFKGIISGLVAGTLKDIPNGLFYHFKITEFTYWDYSGAIGLGRIPQGALEHVAAFFLEVMFSTFLAIIYVYLAPYLKTKHHIIKGMLFGGLIWFTIRIGVLAFHITIFTAKNIVTPIENIFTSLFFGFMLVVSIEFFEKRKRNSI